MSPKHVRSVTSIQPPRCYACNMPAIKPFTRHQIPLRSHSAQILTWGSPSSAPLLMLHGWMDVASSFQFLVDALKRDWYFIAPDQRGYGGSDWTKEGASGYWFADYVADLEAVVDHFSPEAPINLEATVWAAMCAARPLACARIV